MDSINTEALSRGQQRHHDLDSLRRTVMGRVYAPGDAEWDRVRVPWALAVEQTPLAVLEVADAEDVRLAVRWAGQHGRQVTAQPVGHGANDSLDQVLLLRTRALDSIAIDLDAGTATVGAGVKAGELLQALRGTGFTFLAGSNPDPTVVGMTISGGMSWFGRAHGLAANSVVSVDLVDAHGRRRRVTQAADPELFWAVRGGGGDFGIVTEMEIKLFAAPELYGGRLFWPIEAMPAVLRVFREVSRSAPDELSLWYYTYQFPPLPVVPEPLRGRGFAAVAVAYLGSASAAEEWLQPLRSTPGLVMDLLAPTHMADLGDIAGEPTDPMPALEHSVLLTDLDDEVIGRLTAVAGAGSASPLLSLEIRHLGGAFRTRLPDVGAAGHIDEPYILFALGVAAEPGLSEAITGTFGRIDEAVQGHTDGRTVPNFLGAGDDARRAWPPHVRRRLADVKRAVDPLNTVLSNRPVLQLETISFVIADPTVSIDGQSITSGEPLTPHHRARSAPFFTAIPDTTT